MLIGTTLMNTCYYKFFMFLNSFAFTANFQARKGGWRYLDTGQVLIESACSVERVEEAMDTLIPMLPQMHYFRFNPGDSLTEKFMCMS